MRLLTRLDKEFPERGHGTDLSFGGLTEPTEATAPNADNCESIRVGGLRPSFCWRAGPSL